MLCAVCADLSGKGGEGSSCNFGVIIGVCICAVFIFSFFFFFFGGGWISRSRFSFPPFNCFCCCTYVYVRLVAVRAWKKYTKRNMGLCSHPISLGNIYSLAYHYSTADIDRAIYMIAVKAWSKQRKHLSISKPAPFFVTRYAGGCDCGWERRPSERLR